MQLIIPAEAAHDTVYQLGEVSATRFQALRVAPKRDAAATARTVCASARRVPRRRVNSRRAAASRGRAASKDGAPQTGGQCWARAFPR